MSEDIKQESPPATDEDIKHAVAGLAAHLEQGAAKPPLRDAYGELAVDRDIRRDHHPESWCSDIPKAPKEVVRCVCGLLREKSLAHGSRTL